MDDLKKLWIFNEIARNLSFSKAAEVLNLTRPRVSQALQELEEEWDVSLLNRTTRSVSLTEAGELLYQSSKRWVDDFESMRDSLFDQSEKLAGKIRLTCPIDLVEAKLIRCTNEFRALHPNVSFDLLSNDAVVNLMDHNIDLGIRVGWLKDSSMQAIKLSSMFPTLVATPSFIDEHQLSTNRLSQTRLEELPWVGLSLLDTPLKWEFTHKKSKETTLINGSAMVMCNSPVVLRSQILTGSCIGVCPDYQVEEDLRTGRLIHLYPQYVLRKGGIYAVHPYGQRPPRRIRVFLDFLKERLMSPDNCPGIAP